jgi:formylmethanofuran dehydrogenase subunit E
MLSEDDLVLINQIHGHLCPMVLLGARTGRKARRLVAREGHDLNLFGFYRGYGCAVDGIQIFSGCTWGNSNLVLLRGRNFSFTLTVENSREGIMVSPRPEVLDRIRKEKGPENRSSLIHMLGSASDDELVDIESVRDLGVLSGFPGD